MSNLAERTEPAESTAVSMFERLARDPNVDVDKLERLMAMNERMLSASAKQQFDAAFSGMQAELPTINERGQIKVGNEVRSKYALFEDINDAVKPVLQKHGFAVSFRTKVDDKSMVVTGILSHAGGHREETSLPLPFDNSGSKNSVQAIGSSVSYGKRYVMCALLNITSREERDDDGRAADGIDQHQQDELEDLIKQAKADRKKFLEFMGVEHISHIQKAHYRKAVAALNAKQNKG